MKDQGIDSIRPDAGAELPMPRRRVVLRIGVPVLIIGAAALLLTWTGWDVIRSRKEVRAVTVCLLYTSPSPRDATLSRMPSSA